jgi:acetyl-CoA carboxylase biotin carboxyl carrier protein
MASSKSAIDTKLIRQLADMLNETELNEIEVEEGDLRIRLARGADGYSVMQAAPMMAPAAAPAPVAAPAPAAEATPSAAPAAASGPSIPSPMVGTAYLSPAPGADPFIKVGDKIKKGQTVMIVEAMKTMNQIEATQDGVVASIAVEDGQPVEFGQTLIVLG